MIVPDSSSVAVSRDSSSILLLSGDAESKPEPRRRDENSMDSIICSAKIKRGIQQETAPSCTETNCQAKCHQACNGLAVAQTRQAKSCGHNFLWKCPEHGSGIPKIVVPPPPFFKQPIRLSAAGKPCSVCSTPI